MGIDVEWGVATHRGTVRANNQDSVLAAPPIFAVADGMGGHAGGEVASALAVEALGGFAEAAAVDPATVISAIRAANASIHQRSHLEPGLAQMGTTITGLALTRDAQAGDSVLVFNVGDSRVYALVEGRLTQLSSDHSVVNEMVLSGQLTAEQAKTHPARNVITRALGIAPDVDIDAWIDKVSPGQTYLVCSDGLVNEVSLAELEVELARSTDPQVVADAMLAMAIGHGGRDNVSVIVVTLADAQVRSGTSLDEQTSPGEETAEAAAIAAAPGGGDEQASPPPLVVNLIEVPPPSSAEDPGLPVGPPPIVIDGVPGETGVTGHPDAPPEVIDRIPEFVAPAQI